MVKTRRAAATAASSTDAAEWNESELQEALQSTPLPSPVAAAVVVPVQPPTAIPLAVVTVLATVATSVMFLQLYHLRDVMEVAALALIALVSGGLFFSALARVAARKSMVLSAAKNAGPYTDVEGNNFSAALNTTVFFAGLYFVHAYLLPNVVYNLEVAHLMHPLMDASASMILPAALTYVQATSRKYLF